uniref:NB-ARC domain-containing protein n=1 Tax=Arundo donax TaxID=35708 RepID=A0A0A9D4B2_ARUDO
MSVKRTWREWENALKTFKRRTQLLDTSGMKNVDPILETLRISYDNLESDKLKECFLACSLWPEGYSIWTVDLVNCWIGLGLIPIGRTINDSHNDGLSYIERLKKMCLLEEGDIKNTEVRLHDIIRDMALWIASDYEGKKYSWIVQAGHRLRSGVNSEFDLRRWESATRISLMCNFLDSLQSLPSCSDLSVLVLQQNFHFKDIPPSLCQSMSSLKYLDLSWTQIEELPTEFCSLANLRYLNLADSHIGSLPENFGDLKQLIFLNLSYTNNLRRIPSGVISKLSMLKVLYLYQSKYSGFEKELSEKNGEFSLRELKCFDSGLSLGLTVRSALALWMLALLPDTYVHLLGVEQLEGESALGLKLQNTVTVLNFRMCLSIEELSIELADNQDPAKATSHLEYLTFWRLPKLASVNIGVELFIRMLCIVENSGLSDITWILKLPQLEHLDLSFCSNLKYVLSSTDTGVDRYAMQGSKEVHGLSKLRILQLNHLPKLESICIPKLLCPCLEYIDVFGCPLLKDLPFRQESSGVTCLKQIRGEEQWWNSLQWDNDTTCKLLLPFFKVFEKNLETFEPALGTNPFIQASGSFFAHRKPMMRTAIQFSSYLSLLFGAKTSTR